MRAIATIILASSNSFLAPPPSHPLSLLFLFLTTPPLVVGFFCCLFISVCCPFSYDFSSINSLLFKAKPRNCKSLHLHSCSHTEIQIIGLLTVICQPVPTFFSLSMNSLCLSKFRFWATLPPLPLCLIPRRQAELGRIKSWLHCMLFATEQCPHFPSL